MDLEGACQAGQVEQPQHVGHGTDHHQGPARPAGTGLGADQYADRAAVDEVDLVQINHKVSVAGALERIRQAPHSSRVASVAVPANVNTTRPARATLLIVRLTPATSLITTLGA